MIVHIIIRRINRTIRVTFQPSPTRVSSRERQDRQYYIYSRWPWSIHAVRLASERRWRGNIGVYDVVVLFMRRIISWIIIATIARSRRMRSCPAITNLILRIIRKHADYNVFIKQASRITYFFEVKIYRFREKFWLNIFGFRLGKYQLLILR